MNMEERLSALEGRLDTVEAELRLRRDREEIENLMAVYQQMLLGGRITEIPERLWARERQDISLEIGPSGVFLGHQLACYYRKETFPGVLIVHAMTTPAITIAPDGLTASGLWLSIGAEADAGELGPVPPAAPYTDRGAVLTSATPEGKRYMADWHWQNIAVDFCKEHGTWKILHLHAYELFRCPYGQDWVAYAKQRYETDGPMLEALFTPSEPLSPDRPQENLPALATSFHWQYDLDASPAAPPELGRYLSEGAL